MFPPYTVKSTEWAIKNSDLLQTSFFKFDKETQLVVLVNTKRRKILAYLNFLFHCSYVTFLGYRCIQAYLDESVGTQGRILMEYFFGISLMPVLYHVNLLLRSPEFEIFANAYPRVLRQIWDELPQRDDTRPMGNAFLKLLVRSSQMIFFMDLLSVFMQPQSPSLLSSLLPNVNQLEKWKILPFALIQGYIWWTGWSVCHIVALNLLAYMNGLGWTCNRLICRRIRQPTTSTLVKDALAYRKLQVVQIMATDAVSIVLQVQQFLCIILIMRSLYGALVVDGPERGRMIVGIIAHFGFLRGVFKAVAEVYGNSDQVLASWSIHGRDKWFKRFRMSCRALKIDIAGLYYVDHSLMLTMCAIILDGTVNLLVTSSAL